ncbi:nucleoside/nucleotide kinase family protein [Demequina muriae]|uniref:Nucleoside/nucleotide kinase family protein n=1 Tax=Demequina muriae TaxID=3051664 RepID=A0ABT8GEG9_9MICO|nr:nucleoside/nucleotide kinase family protein [Demequina sp. EGI L300058]MDN4479739.1 nucleoside/nucleotide kinase family protein [Demequina sp. EGI L300058]
MTSVEPLVARARSLVANAGGGRVVLGIVGAPGSGKSTLADAVAAGVGAADAVVVPMDGFHLAHTELERLDRVSRKGAPDTFDAAGFVALLRRIVARDEDVVYAPEYRRDLRNGVAGAIPVPRDVPLVIVEGNYLLLDSPPWDQVAGLLAESWFVEIDEAARLERLIARHVAFGRTPEAARAHALGSDQRNAELIAASAHRADLRVAPSPTVDR